MNRTLGQSPGQSLGLVLRNIVFTVVVPGLGGAWLPWWLLTRGATSTPAPAAWEAVPVIAAGAGLYSWCAWNFAAVGGGTPGPWDAPRRVVARGPYRWVRNLYLLPCPAGQAQQAGQAYPPGGATTGAGKSRV